MKFKITKKEINTRFKNVVTVHSGELYHLLYFKNPFAYSVRLEGWACDYYEVGNFCLSSGYCPTGNKSNRELEKYFEVKAKKVMQSNFFKRETKQRKINALLSEFTNQLINK